MSTVLVVLAICTPQRDALIGADDNQGQVYLKLNLGPIKLMQDAGPGVVGPWRAAHEPHHGNVDHGDATRAPDTT